jgi:hypothetical protein
VSAKDDITTMLPGEHILFIVHQRIADEQESYCGPLLIGAYTPGEGDRAEIWIECEGQRVNIPQRYLREVLRMLKQAGEYQP